MVLSKSHLLKGVIFLAVVGLCLWWAIPEGDALFRLADRSDVALQLQLSPDKSRLAIVGVKSLEIVETGSWKSLHVVPGRFFAVAWSLDGQRLCAVRPVDYILIDTATWNTISVGRSPVCSVDAAWITEESFVVTSHTVDVLPGGAFVITPDGTGKAHGEKYALRNDGSCSSVAVTEAGIVVLANELALYSQQSLPAVQSETIYRIDKGFFGKVAASRDGKVIAFNNDSQLHLFRKAENWEHTQFPHDEDLWYGVRDHVAMSEDGSRCAFLARGMLTLIDCENLQIIRQDRVDAGALMFLDNDRLLLGTYGECFLYELKEPGTDADAGSRE